MWYRGIAQGIEGLQYCIEVIAFLRYSRTAEPIASTVVRLTRESTHEGFKERRQLAFAITALPTSTHGLLLLVGHARVSTYVFLAVKALYSFRIV